MNEKTEKVNIFDVLNKFNAHDVEYFRSLPPELDKQIHPFVLQRWLSGTHSPVQVYLLNEISNRKIFTLAHNHKLLVWYLLLAATGRRNVGRYQWNKLPSSKNSSTPKSVEVLCKYYGYSSSKARDALRILAVDDVIELAQEIGMQSDDIQQIEKELRPNNKKSSGK